MTNGVLKPWFIVGKHSLEAFLVSFLTSILIWVGVINDTHAVMQTITDEALILLVTIILVAGSVVFDAFWYRSLAGTIIGALCLPIIYLLNIAANEFAPHLPLDGVQAYGLLFSGFLLILVVIMCAIEFIYWYYF